MYSSWKNSALNRFILIAIVTSAFMGCSQEKNTEGPYFGNGFRNGWADQNSITIWTRLTSIPDLNESGIHFKELTKTQIASLARSTDKKSIHSSQIPKGHTIDQMDASCPGVAGEVKLTYYPQNNLSKKTETKWNSVDPSKNFTKQWKLTGLIPNTSYAVEILARTNDKASVSDTIQGVFKTAPSKTNLDAINFSIVTGHDYNRRDNIENGHQIYNTMLKDDLDFYAHTGDIEYYDKPNPWAMTEELMRYKWDRLFALPFQRKFYTNTTSYFIKDDHDVLRNDSNPGMTYGTVSFERGLEIFDDEQFPSNESTYKTVRWGKNLQIWMVEGRKFRSKNKSVDGPDKTIWGNEQKQWLYKTLEESDATYKVIISATPILGPDRGKKNDNHANIGFQHEGDEIRDFFNKFDNLFLCVGDRHWQYISHTDDTNLWEFSCGPGSDQHASGWKQSDLRPEHKFLRVKGGYLFGSVYEENGAAKIKFEHRDVDGNVVNTEVFPKL
jgi:alkaline phosphatase D